MEESAADIVDIIRAKEEHVPGIKELVDLYSFTPDGSGFLIPMSTDEIGLLVKNQRFLVALSKDSGEVLGCSFLNNYPGAKNQSEVRALAVRPAYQRKRIGSLILEKDVYDAFMQGCEKLYVCTQPFLTKFFTGNGFIHDDIPPYKISNDCISCPRYEEQTPEKRCNEITFSMNPRTIMDVIMNNYRGYNLFPV